MTGDVHRRLGHDTGLEFLTCLQLVALTYPRVKLHVVADNYATHKHRAVKAWFAKNPRITMHSPIAAVAAVTPKAFTDSRNADDPLVAASVSDHPLRC